MQQLTWTASAGGVAGASFGASADAPAGDVETAFGLTRST
jgi:hypothetical protein